MDVSSSAVLHARGARSVSDAVLVERRGDRAPGGWRSYRSVVYSIGGGCSRGIGTPDRKSTVSQPARRQRTPSVSRTVGTRHGSEAPT